MATKTKIAVIIIIIGCAVFFSNCNPIRFDCTENKYTFSATIQAYPDLDSIHIGDTIWFALTIPTQLTDKVTNKVIDYSNAENLGGDMGFGKFNGVGNVNDPGVIPAADDFDYSIKIGNALANPVLPAQNRNYSFNEANNQYKFLLGVTPKQTGVFIMGMGDIANVFRKSDKCTKAFFGVSFVNTNQHLYFIKQNRTGYILSEFDKTHSYCVKVK